MNRLLPFAALSLACAACAADHHAPAATATSTGAGCIAAGGGFLQAQLRGAMIADLDWKNTDMQCEGGPRPDGKGLRLTLAGPLPSATGAPARQLRFIFGVDEHDAASGAAQALPTNLTMILEGEQQMYATRGNDRCAVEVLERTPLAADGKLARVHARGYCLGPATDLSGDARLLVPTFEFTGVMHTELEP